MANRQRQHKFYGKQKQNNTHIAKSPQHLESGISDEQASKIHGLTESNGWSTDSDSGKSNFDEEYYRNKPGPLPITENNTVTINSPNNINNPGEPWKRYSDVIGGTKLSGLTLINHGYVTDNSVGKSNTNKKDFHNKPLQLNTTIPLNTWNISNNRDAQTGNNSIRGTSYQNYSTNYHSTEKTKENAGYSLPQFQNTKAINTPVHTNLTRPVETYRNNFHNPQNNPFTGNVEKTPKPFSNVLTDESKKTSVHGNYATNPFNRGPSTQNNLSTKEIPNSSNFWHTSSVTPIHNTISSHIHRVGDTNINNTIPTIPCRNPKRTSTSTSAPNRPLGNIHSIREPVIQNVPRPNTSGTITGHPRPRVSDPMPVQSDNVSGTADLLSENEPGCFAKFLLCIKC